MARGKYTKRAGTKATALLLALVMLLCGVMGGTIAWLFATPDPVVNTFTYGDINIELEETDTGLDDDDDDNTNQYEMIPGEEITKDPVVTVKEGSEAMWLFVKLEKSENFDTFMEYAVDSSWVKLNETEEVYYRHITAEEVVDQDLAIHIIADDKVTVKETVTKEMLNELDADAQNVTYPTLTVTAYAVQSAGNATAADAWAKATATPETPETPDP